MVPVRSEVPVDGLAQIGVGVAVILTVFMVVGRDEGCVVITAVGRVVNTVTGKDLSDVGTDFPPDELGEVQPAVVIRITTISKRNERHIMGDSE
jgi:hypothetical protein